MSDPNATPAPEGPSDSTASGERAVAVGGNVSHSVIITGDIENLAIAQATVVHSADANRELDGAAALFDKGKPDVAKENFQRSSDEPIPSPFTTPKWVYAVVAMLALAVGAVVVFHVINFETPSTDPVGIVSVDKSDTTEEDQTRGKVPVQALAIWKSSFGVTGKRIPFASPDNTFLLLKERVEAATTSILIGMWGFNAEHVKDLLLSALKKKVKISVLVPRRRPPWKGEEEVLRALMENGADVILAPSGNAAPFFLYHTKLIIIDEKWTLVQSAILTDDGVPLPPTGPNDTWARRLGNRETGIAVESEELARYLTRVLEADMKTAREWKEVDLSGSAGPEPKPQEASPDPVKRYPFEVFDGPEPGIEKTPTSSPAVHGPEAVRVLPVLSPENFMEVVPSVLAAARESVDLQTQHLRPVGPKVGVLLSAIKEARDHNPKLRVRFILSRLGSTDHDVEKLSKAFQEYGLKIDEHLTFLSRRSGANCSSGMLIVDRRVCMVGSTWWGEGSVGKSRAVNLLIDSPRVADYYSRIFDTDWDADR